jgi:hypothetical protein
VYAVEKKPIKWFIGQKLTKNSKLSGSSWLGRVFFILSNSGVKPLSSEMGIKAIFFSFYYQFLFHSSIINYRTNVL